MLTTCDGRGLTNVNVNSTFFPPIMTEQSSLLKKSKGTVPFPLKYGHLSLVKSRYRPRCTKFTCSRAQKKEAAIATVLESDDNDDDEEYENMPFREMKQWKAHKPLGFGHAKTYDTSLEERLLAEVKQSQESQTALAKKTENKTEKKAGKVKDGKQQNGHEKQTWQKVLESVPSAVNVRIGNLPKKKNITRDLQASFKGYPGLLHINPVESANKKTRDPICRGLAFLVFKDEATANRFITRFNGESITFGKIQRKISLCLLSTSAVTNSGFMSPTATNPYTMPRLRIRDQEIEFAEGVTDSIDFPDQQKENHSKSSVNICSGHDNYHGNKELSGENESDNQLKPHCSSIIEKDDLDSSGTRSAQKNLETYSPIASWKDQNASNCREKQQEPQLQVSNIVQNLEGQTLVSKAENINSMKQIIDSTVLASQPKKQILKRKGQTKHKSKKPIESKHSDTTAILGSAHRLKKKERSVLSDVLVKYGRNGAS